MHWWKKTKMLLSSRRLRAIFSATNEPRRSETAYLYFGSASKRAARQIGMGCIEKHLNKKSFGICGIAILRKNQLICVEMLRDQLRVFQWRNNDPIDWIKQRAKIGNVTAITGTPFKNNKIGHIRFKLCQKTCVTSACDILGIKPWFCYTPAQLKKRLLKKYNFKKVQL